MWHSTGSTHFAPLATGPSTFCTLATCRRMRSSTSTATNARTLVPKTDAEQPQDGDDHEPRRHQADGPRRAVSEQVADRTVYVIAHHFAVVSQSHNRDQGYRQQHPIQ